MDIAQTVEALLERLIALGPEAVDPLMAALQPEARAARRAADPRDETDYWAAMALCDIGDPRAVPVLMAYYRTLGRENWEVEEAVLARSLWQLGSAVVAPLVDVIRDATLGWFPRTEAVSSLLPVLETAPEERPRVIAAVRESVMELLQCARDGETLGEDAIELISMFVTSLVDLRDDGSLSLVQELYDRRLVDHAIIDRKGAERDLLRPPDPVVLSTCLKGYTRQYLECRPAPTAQRPVSAPRRPGRNDPCHCGSGKKYKKCCLDRDQRA